MSTVTILTFFDKFIGALVHAPPLGIDTIDKKALNCSETGPIFIGLNEVWHQPDRRTRT